MRLKDRRCWQRNTEVYKGKKKKTVALQLIDTFFSHHRLKQVNLSEASTVKADEHHQVSLYLSHFLASHISAYARSHFLSGAFQDVKRGRKKSIVSRRAAVVGYSSVYKYGI